MSVPFDNTSACHKKKETELQLSRCRRQKMRMMPTNWNRTSKQTRKQPSKQARMLDQPGPLDQRNNQIIDECENMKWDGGFYREIKGSRGRGRDQ